MSWLHHWLVPHESNNQRAKLLHPSSWALLIGVLVVFQAVIGFTAQTFPQILGYASQIAPDEIVRLTNVERANQGLGAVKLDGQLSAAAAQKAADMFARDYWAHVSPIGTQPWYFVTQSGYEYRYAGENLARDFFDPNGVVAAWMNSPSHRENLLSDKYQDIGVAVVDGKLGGQETTLVVQMFGTRLSSTGPSIAKAATDISVKAAESTPAPKPTVIPSLEPTLIPTLEPTPEVVLTVIDTPTPVAVVASARMSPFSLTKAVSLGVMAIIVLVLGADIIMVRRKHIVRWTSKSAAHLAFMMFLLIAAAIVYSGQIL